MKTPRSDKAWKAYKHSSNAQHIRSESCRLETELAEARFKFDQEVWRNHPEAVETLVKERDIALAKLEKCRTALERLRDCDWVITLPDRMDAVRSIAREVLEETK